MIRGEKCRRRKGRLHAFVTLLAVRDAASRFKFLGATPRRAFLSRVGGGALAISVAAPLAAPATETPLATPTAPPALVDIVRCRNELAAFEPLSSSTWPDIKAALNSLPFTDPGLPRVDVNGRGNTPRRIPIVGNALRRQTQFYERQLQYREGPTSGSAESISLLRKQYKTDGLGDSDALIRADLDMRDLYRNDCLTWLQEMADELEYLERAAATPEPPDGADLDAARGKALLALDQYLDRVPRPILNDAVARARGT